MAGGNPLEDSDPGDWFSQKGGTFGGGGGGGPAGGGPGGGGGFGGTFGGGGSGFLAGPRYDRQVPTYGYRRLAFGPIGNQRTQGPAGNDYSAMAGNQNFATPSWAQQSSGSESQGPGGGMPNPGGGPSQASWSPYSGDQRGDLLGAWNRLFGQAGQAGVYDPMGSQALLGQIGQMFAQQAGGRQAGMRNSIMANGGDDPNAFAYGSLMGDLGLQHDLSGAQSQAQLASMLQNQQWLQSLASGLEGQSSNQGIQNQLLSRQRQPGSGLGQMLGGIGGAALGSFLGPMGTSMGGSLGSSLGGMFGGGTRSQQIGSGYDPYGYNPANDPSYGWGGGNS